jgi:hypothetical protein
MVEPRTDPLERDSSCSANIYMSICHILATSTKPTAILLGSWYLWKHVPRLGLTRTTQPTIDECDRRPRTSFRIVSF